MFWFYINGHSLIFKHVLTASPAPATAANDPMNGSKAALHSAYDYWTQKSASKCFFPFLGFGDLGDFGDFGDLGGFPDSPAHAIASIHNKRMATT